MENKSKQDKSNPIDQLKYRSGTPEYKKKLEEVLQNKDKVEPKEVNLLGENFGIIGRQIILKVRVFNPELGVTSEYEGVEYLDICPVDGNLMLVRKIKGATKIATCSNECKAVVDKVIDELKDQAKTKVPEKLEVKKE
jgi:hypothetical protein